MRRFLFLLTMIVCASVLLFSQAAGNKRYVAVQSVELKDSTGFFAKDVGNLSLGTEVTAIRENGKWTQIQSENGNGWVASASLSTRRVVTSNSSVSASEIALAGKGFSQDTEKEYRQNGLDYSIVDFMEKIMIATDDLLRFITEGRLAKGE